MKRFRLTQKHALGAVLASAVVLAFQNCAQSTTGTTDAASAYAQALPFAYQAKLDTMAYMSCSEITNNPGAALMQRAYFTFRAGAYNSNTGGLALTSQFRNMSTAYTPEARAGAIQDSTSSANTRLIFSMRVRQNLNSVWSEKPGVGLSQMGFLPAMSDPMVAGPLMLSDSGLPITATRYLNYFPGAEDKRLLEASLSVTAADADATNARAYLSGAGATPLYLVAGYGNSSDELEQNLRQPIVYASDGVTAVTTPANRAYGVGYSLNFSLPYGMGSGETRVLTGITEYDLTTGLQQASNWSCPSSYQFTIVRPEDIQAGYVSCAMTADPNFSSNPTYQAAQVAIRRVLRTEDWYVDVPNRCVVPKNTGDVCYGTYGATATVYQPLYNVTACTKSNSTNGTTCAHYVSVCTRT